MLRVPAEHNVGSSPCHICGYRNCAGASGFGYDVRLALMVLCVEDIMLHTTCLEHS